MATSHKHAELIKAWADGAEIEYHTRSECGWVSMSSPSWSETEEYRIKPAPKPGVVKYGRASHKYEEYFLGSLTIDPFPKDNLMLTFDGETGKLIKAEVI